DGLVEQLLERRNTPQERAARVSGHFVERRLVQLLLVQRSLSSGVLASGPRSGLPPRQPTPSVPNLNASRRVQTTKNRKQRAGCAPRRTRSAKERRPSSSEPSPNVPGNHRVRPSRPRTSHRPV